MGNGAAPRAAAGPRYTSRAPNEDSGAPELIALRESSLFEIETLGAQWTDFWVGRIGPYHPVHNYCHLYGCGWNQELQKEICAPYRTSDHLSLITDPI